MLFGVQYWPRIYCKLSSLKSLLRLYCFFLHFHWRMKFTIQINTGPYTHQASDTAYHFTRAALKAGHTIHRIFFYHDGVNNSSIFNVPPRDERNIQQLWSTLAQENSLDMVVCAASAQRRGILDQKEADRHAKPAANIAPNFAISGLGQLIEAAIVSDRLLIFGD